MTQNLKRKYKIATAGTEELSHFPQPMEQEEFKFPEPKQPTPEEEEENEKILTLTKQPLATAEELYMAINRLYENIGDTNCSVYLVGTASVHVQTFTSGGRKHEGYDAGVSAYFASPEPALQAVLSLLCMLKINPNFGRSDEVKEDKLSIAHPTRIVWRMRPELIKTENNLYMVRMRAGLL